MNFTTLSGVYENSRAVLRTLGAPETVSDLRQRLQVIAKDDTKLIKLLVALMALESHTRVMGMTQMLKEDAD